MENDILKWIQNWYQSNCNGDWEHSNGVSIQTLDNPGWRVEIDLKDTKLEGLQKEYVLSEVNENDWYGTQIKDSKYIGVGDAGKLIHLLISFKEIVEAH